MSNILRGTIVNPDVIRGKSAYEIAVMHGFEGTEEEWLESLPPKIEKAIETKKQEALDAVEASAEAAKGFEEGASSAYRVAQIFASQAKVSADNAETEANRAEESANRAESIVETNSAAAAQAATAKADEVIVQRIAELGIVQTPGNSTTAVMSQKATTDAINDLYDLQISVGDVTDGKFIGYDGIVADNTGSCATDFIPVEEGYTLLIDGCLLTYGRSVCGYGENKALVECIATDSTETSVTYTVPSGVCYIRATGAVGVPPKITKTNHPINVELGKIKEDLSKFKVVQITGDSKNDVMSQKATTETVENAVGEIVAKIAKSANLFDKNGLHENGVINFKGVIAQNQFIDVYTIPVSIGKTYTFPLLYSAIGNYEAYRVCCFNSSKEYLGYITGSPTEDNALLTVTISDVFEDAIAYIKVNVSNTGLTQSTHYSNFMLVEGSTYPAEYIYYVPNEKRLKEDVIVSTVPRLMVSHIAHRTNPKKFQGHSDEYAVFVDTYMAFENNLKNTGALYGLTERPAYSASEGVNRKQFVYRSFDGGDTWEKLGEIPCFVPADDSNAGEWANSLFVDPMNEYIYLFKTTDGLAGQHNKLVTGYFSEDTWYTIGSGLQLGNRGWLSNTNSIDCSTNRDWSKRVVMFGEYGVGLYDEDPTYRIWRTDDGGVTWTPSLEIRGDYGSLGTGEIRHFHCVQRDPYIVGHWWAAAGDENHQCKIFRTTDDGLTWKQIFPLPNVAGTQQERTCSFIIDKDYIYYGMDTPTVGKNNVKLFRIDKSKIDSIANIVGTSNITHDPRELIGVVDSGYPVYCLTKVDYPEGFLVWTVFEKSTNNITNRHVVEFYDYVSKRLYPVATFDTSEAMKAGHDYVGFTSASRYACKFTGTVVVKPHFTMEQGKYGYSVVSRHIKVKVTT